MRFGDTAFAIALALIVAFAAYDFGLSSRLEKDADLRSLRSYVYVSTAQKQIVWQEMPKLAWQTPDGSPCEVGYQGECSLLEAGSTSYSVDFTDAGTTVYDVENSCTCRVVRAKP